MTRLLKTPIIGCTVARVDSSRIDMLAGLSKCDSLRTPPGFWASAGPPANTAIADPTTTFSASSLLIISDPLLPLVARQPRRDHDVVRPCVGCLRESAETVANALRTRRQARSRQAFAGARPLKHTRVGAGGRNPRRFSSDPGGQAELRT